MFLKVTKDANLPTRATKFSAGVDVYANEDCVIGAGETAVVRLGIRIDIQKIDEHVLKGIPYGYEASLIDKTNEFMKSHFMSLKIKRNLKVKGLISHSAVIDLDFEDELKMIIHNPIIDENFNDCVGEFGSARDTFIESRYKIKKGDKIGQLLLMEHKSFLFGIESEEERTGGFGSTGD